MTGAGQRPGRRVGALPDALAHDAERMRREGPACAVEVTLTLARAKEEAPSAKSPRRA